MSKYSSGDFESKTAGIGIVFFILLCGFPALELTGFGFGIDISLQTAVLCSIAGGVVGGILICPKPWQAGMIGGLIAGPSGLLAVYFYTSFRQEVFNLELVIVQGVASLPGVGVGRLIESMFTSPDDPTIENKVSTYDDCELP